MAKISKIRISGSKQQKSKNKQIGNFLLALQNIVFDMTSNQRNILHPLTITINKSFELDSVSEDSMNNTELLRLEIEQLKRQNTFLKRKIWQMQTGKQSPKFKCQKKQSLNCFNILKKNALLTAKDPQQNSLSCIFIEIQNILQSLASIHRLQINKQLWVPSEYQGQVSTLLSFDELSFIKQSKLKKQKIGRKLEIIALQKEQTRYGALLEVFTEFYLLKAEEQGKIKKQIQKFIQKTLEIGKQLIESASNRNLSRSMRSSFLSSIHKISNEPFSPCSGNKQNLQRFQSRFKTQRHQAFQSTIMKEIRMDDQDACSQDKGVK